MGDDDLDFVPQFKVTVPGRVNIIGEHIDHQNYGVLPCAIQKFITAKGEYTCLDRHPLLICTHANSTKYPSRTFATINDLVIDKVHHWTNYVIAAYFGIVEFLTLQGNADKVGTNIDPRQGLSEDLVMQAGSNSPTNFSYRLHFDGNIPPAAGLSSSSALVVCAAMCLDAAGAERPRTSPSLLATICANAERYVGTAGGGMDQAAICLSRAGMAQFINFNPLSAEPVHLPDELAIVIANTGREAPKVRDAGKMYNKRVFELKTACLELISRVNPEAAKAMSGDQLLALTLREVVRTYLRMDEEAVLQRLSSMLDEGPYTKSKMDAILGEDRRNYLLEKRCGQAVWDVNDQFLPFQRIEHVLKETIRVRHFVHLCQFEVNPGKATDPAVLDRLGQLLNESGESLKTLYDCSCQEIEDLCAIARRAGALGSRLTGAGWGGCTVSLVMKDKVDSFVKQVDEEYWRGRDGAFGCVEDRTFASLAGDSAKFFWVDKI